MPLFIDIHNEMPEMPAEMVQQIKIVSPAARRTSSTLSQSTYLAVTTVLRTASPTLPT
jgi:hypothetical protein